MPKLTDRFLSAFKPAQGQKDRLVFDTECRGLGIRATAAGTKTFLVQWTDPATGQKRREPLGVWGGITVDQAREAARVRLGAVAKGLDPRAEREAKRASVAREREASRLTLRALLGEWSRLGLKGRREGYRSEAVRAVSHAFAGHLNRPAHHLTRDEAVLVLDGLAGAGRAAMAGRTMAYGRACYGWAQKRPVRPEVGIHGPDIGREGGPQPSFVARDRRPAAEEVLGRADDVLAVDDRQYPPVGHGVEEGVHSQRQGRVARVQHVVEGEDPVRRCDGGGEAQVAGQVPGRVPAIDVEEADDAAARRVHKLARRHRPAVALEHGEAPGRHPVRGAVRLEAPAHAGVRPSEGVDRQRPLAVGKGERHGDEQPTLEHPDLGYVAGDARGRLPREQPDDDARREERGHAADGKVTMV
jgi:hypothetical protein